MSPIRLLQCEVRGSPLCHTVFHDYCSWFSVLICSTASLSPHKRSTSDCSTVQRTERNSSTGTMIQWFNQVLIVTNNTVYRSATFAMEVFSYPRLSFITFLFLPFHTPSFHPSPCKYPPFTQSLATSSVHLFSTHRTYSFHQTLRPFWTKPRWLTCVPLSTVNNTLNRRLNAGYLARRRFLSTLKSVLKQSLLILRSCWTV